MSKHKHATVQTALVAAVVAVVTAGVISARMSSQAAVMQLPVPPMMYDGGTNTSMPAVLPAPPPMQGGASSVTTGGAVGTMPIGIGTSSPMMGTPGMNGPTGSPQVHMMQVGSDGATGMIQMTPEMEEKLLERQIMNVAFMIANIRRQISRMQTREGQLREDLAELQSQLAEVKAAAVQVQ